jgi:quinolinate synthase
MQEKIKELLKHRNAIMLAHNYQPPEIQELADLCGDSLELSIKASKTDADVILFCGVHFMAETASILSPDKTVLLPRQDAGCPMADMVTAERLAKTMSEMPPMPVVTYVNSTAAVKALSTVCCTSANVVKIVESLDENEILMTPDRNLARYAATQTDKKIHYWEGYCPIHDRLTPEAVEEVKASHPNAVFMAHPECRPEILAMADVVLSTSGMIRYAEESPEKEFIVGTEIGLLYPLKQKSPNKTFVPASEEMFCPDMKKITLEDIAACLENMQGEVKVSENIRKPAFKAVQRMIELS